MYSTGHYYCSTSRLWESTPVVFLAPIPQNTPSKTNEYDLLSVVNNQNKVSSDLFLREIHAWNTNIVSLSSNTRRVHAWSYFLLPEPKQVVFSQTLSRSENTATYYVLALDPDPPVRRQCQTRRARPRLEHCNPGPAK